MLYLLIPIGLGIVLLLLYLRRPQAAVHFPQSVPAARPPAHPYRCVSIRVGRNGCEVAQEFRGKRFLPDEAPTLPLPGCTAGHCDCVYRRHRDRRSHARRNPFDLRTASWSSQAEDRRRPRRGRREEDREAHGD